MKSKNAVESKGKEVPLKSISGIKYLNIVLNYSNH